ncbi:response regulator [Desulfopila sp. IMCC35008]|uniref:response regulator n=1 Tax=Desulfopila sp. IMCC35008 TaxID=2653858 RepID=UPI0013D857BE|nr:response regulator [Desulfopila sp. IMCC35008]
MKILIVDDTKLSRMMILKRMPPQIKESSTILQGENGQEAVDLYKEHSPDILFLDLTMPVMDGFEALNHIMEYNPKALVYVITADIQAKAVERVTAAGARSLEAKPISEERLAEIFSSHKDLSI